MQLGGFGVTENRTAGLLTGCTEGLPALRHCADLEFLAHAPPGEKCRLESIRVRRPRRALDRSAAVHGVKPFPFKKLCPLGPNSLIPRPLVPSVPWSLLLADYFPEIATLKHEGAFPVADNTALIHGASGQDAPDRPLENAALVRCVHAFQRAYKKELDDLDDDDSKYPAELAGRRAYLRALPPLAGYENIRDFIACIAYADLTEVILHCDADHFLDSAKVALAAVCHQPKPRAKAPGSPAQPPPAGGQ